MRSSIMPLLILKQLRYGVSHAPNAVHGTLEPMPRIAGGGLLSVR